MPTIAFIDSEINPETGTVLDLGATLDNGATFHKNSLPEFLKFIENADFICGHNILNHDLKGEASPSLQPPSYLTANKWRFPLTPLALI
jgi:hypothetical protein